VHASPSLQAAPFGRGGFEHAPVPGLHSPGRWHWSSAEHSTKLAGVQIPLWHASPSVQPLPAEFPDSSLALRLRFENR